MSQFPSKAWIVVSSLPPEVFVADDGKFPFPVSGVGIGVDVLVIGAAWHVTGFAGHDFYFVK